MLKKMNLFSRISFLKDISIKLKFIIFMGIIIVQSAGTILYLRHQFDSNHQAIIQQQEQLSNLKNIQEVEEHFSQIMYWFTEMAVTLSDESQETAIQNKDLLVEKLFVTESYAPKLAENIRKAIPVITEKYYTAIDSFFDGDFNTGSKLIGIARQEADALFSVIKSESIKMRLSTAQAGNNVIEISLSAISLTNILLAVMILSSIIFTALQISLIVNPLNKMTSAMRQLSEGDFAVEVGENTRKDEIGLMARTLEIFRKNGLETLELEKQKEEENIKKAEKAKFIEDTANAFQQDIEQIAHLLMEQTKEVKDLADSMLSLARTTNKEFMMASEASHQASRNVEEVASTVEQFNASIREISDQLSQANQVTTDTAVKAEEANEKVRLLNEAGIKIQEAVSLINDIAEKTNLLALNATIEAARAGEAGKGFAVVANEVKDLASQTSRATDDIGELVKNIQSSTEDTASAMTEIAARIGEMTQSSSVIASAIEEQHATIQSVSQNANHTSENNKKVNDSIEGVTKNAIETEQAANKVLEAVQTMTEKQSELDMVINDFLTKVKAA